MTIPAKEELKACRDAFEKWYINYFGDTGTTRASLRLRDNEEYAFTSTQIEWTVWQSAWNISKGELK